MRRLFTLLACVGMLLPAATLIAQVPHVLTYQGRVTSGGTNFSGTGQFKFALVSGGTTAAAPASGSATVYFGFVVQIAVTSGGAGYVTAPAVTITDSSGSGATAMAQVANGQVISIAVTDAGAAYSANPTITIAPPPANLSYTTYWSHDGSSSAGGEPVSAIPVAVSQGLFTVGLGDTLVPNMTALPPQALANPDVRLRIWFNDGVNGFSQLSPDQRLTSAAYAMMADSVRDGAITAAKLAPGSVTAAQIEPGSITANQLADGAVTSAKLGANVNLGPPRGSVILSTNENDLSLIAAGYSRMPGMRVQMDEWQSEVSSTSIPGRWGHSAIWTGNEMIVWGGRSENGDILGGGRYNPTSNSWVTISTNGAPVGIWRHPAFWTGTEMIIWDSPEGWAYNLESDSWRDISPQNPIYGLPVWSGTELIVWGGASGGRYNPTTGIWAPISTQNAPVGALLAVWSGTEAIYFHPEIGGGRYNPTANTWLRVSTNSMPGYGKVAVWTGSEMIVWGGIPEAAGIYNPAINSWRTMRRGNLGNQCNTGVWIGSKLAVLAGWNSVRAGLYDPVLDSWEVMTTSAPFNGSEDCGATIVWTGAELLVYGGRDLPGAVYRVKSSPSVFLYQMQ